MPATNICLNGSLLDICYIMVIILNAMLYLIVKFGVNKWISEFWVLSSDRSSVILQGTLIKQKCSNTNIRIHSTKKCKLYLNVLLTANLSKFQFSGQNLNNVQNCNSLLSGEHLHDCFPPDGLIAPDIMISITGVRHFDHEHHGNIHQVA